MVGILIEGVVDFDEVEQLGVRFERWLVWHSEVCPSAGSDEVFSQNAAHSTDTLAGLVD